MHIVNWAVDMIRRDLSVLVAISLAAASMVFTSIDSMPAEAAQDATAVPKLVGTSPRVGKSVRGRQRIRIRFDSEVLKAKAVILMPGVRRSRQVRAGRNRNEVSIRLPKNLQEGRPIKIVLSGAQPKPWSTTVQFRAGFRLKRSNDGTRIVSGRDPVQGKRGRIIRYTVEVQGSLRGHAHKFLNEATRILGNQRRGWTAARSRRIQRVDNPRRAHIRLLLAKPRLVDRLCARGGMNTGGIYSCWNSEYAALNLWRWRKGAAGFRSIGQYREYLINHEFGHGLGYGHTRCRGRRKLAPVMEQQSISLRGCRANGWPYRSSSHGRSKVGIMGLTKSPSGPNTHKRLDASETFVD